MSLGFWQKWHEAACPEVDGTLGPRCHWPLHVPCCLPGSHPDLYRFQKRLQHSLQTWVDGQRGFQDMGWLLRIILGEAQRWQLGSGQ